ncbi:MAG: hypothetical protein ACE5ET_05500 [Gammaproteobacteria bacterium]
MTFCVISGIGGNLSNRSMRERMFNKGALTWAIFACCCIASEPDLFIIIIMHLLGKQWMAITRFTISGIKAAAGLSQGDRDRREQPTKDIGK